MTIEEYNKIASKEEVLRLQREVLPNIQEGQLVSINRIRKCGIFICRDKYGSHVYFGFGMFEDVTEGKHDEMPLLTYVPQSLFAEFVYTLMLDHIASHPGCMRQFLDYYEGEIDYRLYALVDTFSRRFMLFKRDSDEVIAKVRARMDKIYKTQASRYQDDVEKLHKTRIRAAVEQLLEEFGDVRDKMVSRYRDDLNWCGKKINNK